MPIHEIKNLKNYFLIAMPILQDPLFKQSVIYICEHNNTGAMGIIINKLIEQCTIETIVNNLGITLSNHNSSSIQLNKPVFSGGPLLNDRGFILHTSKTGFSSSINISEKTMITTSKDVLETLGTPNQPQDILIALGYSGWIKGQLEHELIENIWLTIPANEKILFHTPVISRWNEAIKILGINIYNITYKTGNA